MTAAKATTVLWKNALWMKWDTPAFRSVREEVHENMNTERMKKFIITVPNGSKFDAVKNSEDEWTFKLKDADDVEVDFATFKKSFGFEQYELLEATVLETVLGPDNEERGVFVRPDGKFEGKKFLRNSCRYSTWNVKKGKPKGRGAKGAKWDHIKEVWVGGAAPKVNESEGDDVTTETFTTTTGVRKGDDDTTEEVPHVDHDDTNVKEMTHAAGEEGHGVALETTPNVIGEEERAVSNELACAYEHYRSAESANWKTFEFMDHSTDINAFIKEGLKRRFSDMHREISTNGLDAVVHEYHLLNERAIQRKKLKPMYSAMEAARTRFIAELDAIFSRNE